MKIHIHVNGPDTDTYKLEKLINHATVVNLQWKIIQHLISRIPIVLTCIEKQFLFSDFIPTPRDFLQPHGDTII